MEWRVTSKEEDGVEWQSDVRGRELRVTSEEVNGVESDVRGREWSGE